VTHIFTDLIKKRHLHSRQREKKFPVESAWSAKSRIDGINSVGGSDDYDVLSFLEAVHQGKQSRDDRGVYLVLLAGADRSQAI